MALELRSGIAPWTLPTPIQGATALTDRGSLYVLGGLSASGVSLSTVTAVEPNSGSIAPAPALPIGVHDAAGAVLLGRLIVFGGGASTSLATVQQAGGRVIGSLPAARSDLGATVIGGRAYIVGGYDGNAFQRDVLATATGSAFRVVATLPQGVRYPAVAAIGGRILVVGGELANGASSAEIVAVDVDTGSTSILGQLPMPLSHASALAIGGQVFVAGGFAPAGRRTDQIWRIDPGSGSVSHAGLLPYAVADGAAAVVGGAGYLIGGTRNDGSPLSSSIVLRAGPVATASSSPGHGMGHLLPGSDPSVLPGPILIADEDNNRLLEVSPGGQVVWRFPRSGDLAPGQTFRYPDDAFFTPDGSHIIATEELNFTVSLIEVGTHRLVWQYGRSGIHGSGPNRLWNPDDAMALPDGSVQIADIKNCRIVVVKQGSHVISRSYGQPGVCRHDPPTSFGSPNGAFPLNNGNWLVTEINGNWVSDIGPGGRALWSTHPPGIAYPSDTNQVGPNRYLTVDYSDPGQVLLFDRSGAALWRYRPTGASKLNHPSLALGLPNGDVLLNDDANHRVVVVDPRTDQVVWQYGATGQPGSAAGLLDNPDGVDLAPPYSLLGQHPTELHVIGG